MSEQSQWWLLGIWASWRLTKSSKVVMRSVPGACYFTVMIPISVALSPARWLELQLRDFISCRCQCCWCASCFRSSWGHVGLLAVVSTISLSLFILTAAYIFSLFYSVWFFFKEYEAIYLAKLTIKMMSPMQLGRSFSLQAGVAGLCESPLSSSAPVSLQALVW